MPCKVRLGIGSKLLKIKTYRGLLIGGYSPNGHNMILKWYPPIKIYLPTLIRICMEKGTAKLLFFSSTP